MTDEQPKGRRRRAGKGREGQPDSGQPELFGEGSEPASSADLVADELEKLRDLAEPGGDLETEETEEAQAAPPARAPLLEPLMQRGAAPAAEDATQDRAEIDLAEEPPAVEEPWPLPASRASAEQPGGEGAPVEEAPAVEEPWPLPASRASAEQPGGEGVPAEEPPIVEEPWPLPASRVSAEQPGGEGVPVEEPPIVEEPWPLPASRVSAEQPGGEGVPVEEAPAVEEPWPLAASRVSAEEPSSEGAPAGQASAVEEPWPLPASRVSAEESSSEGAPAEQAPAVEEPWPLPASRVSAEEPSSEGAPAGQAPAVEEPWPLPASRASAEQPGAEGVLAEEAPAVEEPWPLPASRASAEQPGGEGAPVEEAPWPLPASRASVEQPPAEQAWPLLASRADTEQPATGEALTEPTPEESRPLRASHVSAEQPGGEGAALEEVGAEGSWPAPVGRADAGQPGGEGAPLEEVGAEEPWSAPASQQATEPAGGGEGAPVEEGWPTPATPKRPPQRPGTPPLTSPPAVRRERRGARAVERRGAQPERGRRGAPEKGAGFSAVLVERDDDLATILGKLDTADSPHVALVTHGGNHEMEENRLSLRRIRRHAEQTGKDAVVVTRRWGLRAKARREGLRTAYMTRGIRWGRRRRRVRVSAIPLLGGLTRLVVGLAVILGVFVGAYLVIPSATVTVRASITPVSKPLEVLVSTGTDAADYEFAQLPAQRLKLSMPFSVAVPVTGEKQQPTGKATGTVEFTNPKAELVTIPAGARLKTDKAVVFVTDEELEVGPGATKDVGVTALNPGDSGAVDADTITIVDGSLLGKVTVTNPEPTDPGGTETVPAVSNEDLANLRTVVVTAIADRALKELKEANAGALIFPETIDVSVVDEKFDHEVGDVANWITIDAETSITALGISEADLRGLARFWLADELFDDEVLLDSTLNAEVAPGSSVEYDLDSQTVAATLLLEGGVVPSFDPKEVQAKIAGSSAADAEAYLAEQFDSLTQPTVERGPSWLPGGLPRFDWRIKLVVEPGP